MLQDLQHVTSKKREKIIRLVIEIVLPCDCERQDGKEMVVGKVEVEIRNGKKKGVGSSFSQILVNTNYINPPSATQGDSSRYDRQ